TGIQKSRDSMLSDAQSVASDVNQSLSSIAKLNGQIANAVASGNDASSLKDQRDQLVTVVASKIGAKTIAGDNGQITLFAAGTTLVDGNTASSISVQADANDNLQIQAHRSDGTTLDVTSYVADGSLGGIKEARDTDATSTLNQLDQYAYDLSNAFNSINASGYGTDGTTGNNIFVAPASVTGAAKAMALDPGIIGKPEKIAASSTAAGLPGGNDLAVKLAGLASAPLGGTTQSPTARFATIASSLGIAKQSADNEVSLRQSTVGQAQTMNDSASGVSLDEEMTNLTQYQRAFEASSKVLQAVDELLQNLIQSL
ncbi:MAG: flagellar hook-associated protein FlgK, partial [Polyangiaceae bacterium]